MTERSFIPGFISEQAKRLAAVGIDTAKAEIEWILCHVLKLDRLHMYLHGYRLFDDAARERFEAIMTRRLTREPLQFIINEAWFYGRKFYVNPSVMAPTPETEGLCESAMGFIEKRGIERPSILDLGTGSGVVAVTLACELETADIVALDISTDALAVAIRNAQELEAGGRIDFRESDYFSALADDERFDLILSNPPYICEGEYGDLMPEVKADPKIAMTSGEDGLDAIRVIVREAWRYLKPGGRAIFEMGLGHAETVMQLAQENGHYDFIRCMKDLNDIDRIMTLGVPDVAPE